jgi:hypothetical protein
MIDIRLPRVLPKYLHRYFCEVAPAQINPAERPHYVINRLLDKGNLAAARWVLQNFPRELIVQTLCTIGDFSPWSGRFWARYLEIPEDQVACLKPSRLRMRKVRWPN